MNISIESFFEPNSGSGASIKELERAVLVYKHKYLASSDRPLKHRRHLLNRLIECRRLLCEAKDRVNQGTFVEAPDQGKLVLRSSSESELHGGSVKMGANSQQHGHQMYAASAFRLFGSVCESCCRLIRGPTGRVLVCRACSVVCHHSDDCLRGLTRVCPAALTQRAARMSVSAGTKQTKKRAICPSTEFTNSPSFQMLVIDRLFHLTGSLSGQSWRCWECHCRLKPSATAPGVEARQNSASHPPHVGAISERLAHLLPPIKMTSDLGSGAGFLNDIGQMAGLFSPEVGPISFPADAAVADAVNIINLKGAQDSREPQVALLCHYTGHYFCRNCHWSDHWPIPANIFLLGVSTPLQVSRSSLLWLQYNWDRQQFCAPKQWLHCNPWAVLTGSLRLRAFRLLPYFRICSFALDLKTDFERTQPAWILEQPFTYTMWLVERVMEGALASSLEALIEKVDEHIDTCKLCQSMVSSVCAVCLGVCLRPHQPLHSLCSVCWATVHRACLEPPQPAEMDDDSEDPYLNYFSTRFMSTSARPNGWPDHLGPSDIVEVLHPTLTASCRLCAHLGSGSGA